MFAYAKFTEAERRINEGLIRLDEQGAALRRRSFHPSDRMKCMAAFLKRLGNPQAGISAVHVAGTSGKGSVSAAIAGILMTAGLKTGLHVSPYLQVPTEKIQIDGVFVSAEEFVDLVDWVMPSALDCLNEQTPASIHGMASVAMAFEAFRRNAVDVIVCEAGCGARFDLTNFLDTEVAVVTNIGLDHLQSLGPSIEDIAWHKAGCAKPGKTLVTGATGRTLEVIRREAESVGAHLVAVPSSGDPLMQNRQIAAIAAADIAKALGISITDRMIEDGIQRIRLPARIECLSKDGPSVFMDGAHNEDKLAVAVRAMHAQVDKRNPVVAVVGFLGAKAGPSLIRPFAGRVDHVVTTEPAVLGKPPFPAEDTARLFRNAGVSAEAVAEPHQALNRALELAGSRGAVWITGSFYLAGVLRDRWYPAQRVAMMRTSWP